MHLNDDLAARTVVHAARRDWIPSPSPGVDRRMLFRLGEETARATSVVRYAPRSQFPRHVHHGGEEFIVLEGIFQDENGDYPPGSYVRNPPGSSHAPGSEGGCVIFVKLWQFRRDDNVHVVREPDSADANGAERVGGASVELFNGVGESVCLRSWAPDSAITLANQDGLELFVLSGGFRDDLEEFERWSWLRLPAGMDLHGQAASAGCHTWLKTGPLLPSNVCEF